MYIDPGSSSFIIQILIGAAAGAGLAIATFWRRIRSFFSRSKDRDAPTTAAQPGTPPPPPPVTPATPATPPPSPASSDAPPPAAPPAEPTSEPDATNSQE